ncbi:cop9 signalosome complex subunit 7 [Anaeramoeba ignava]|uniref:Cop9 signalosome complex subunit 7 n=1 Tax=Anaeramoeba ignava TaxID=1746090 RepID=A0A9Q0LH87_ANAIG|nr:cop9 signalosome complex subunit 7 [Anaeramoeba ignava]
MSSQTVTEVTNGGRALEKFMILSKQAKGKACVELIKKACAEPELFVFGELVNLPQIQALKSTEDASYLQLLELFAYGTYQDYKKNSKLPKLTEPQLKKLKMLTIVSMTYKSKVVKYEDLQKELEIQSVRELEDLIIEAIYSGLIEAKLDHKNKRLDISNVMGRDVKPDELGGVLDIFTQWFNLTEQLLESLDEKSKFSVLMFEANEDHKKEVEKKITDTTNLVKLSMKNNKMDPRQRELIAGQQMGFGDYYDDDDDERKDQGSGLMGFGKRFMGKGFHGRRNN